MRSGCPSVLTPSNIYSPESTSTLPDASTRRDFNVIEPLGTYLKSSEKKFRIASRPRTGSRPSGISTASSVYSAAKPSKSAALWAASHASFIFATVDLASSAPCTIIDKNIIVKQLARNRLICTSRQPIVTLLDTKKGNCRTHRVDQPESVAH